MNPIKINLVKDFRDFPVIGKCTVQIKLELIGGTQEEREKLAAAMSSVFDEHDGKYITPGGVMIHEDIKGRPDGS